MRPTEILSQEHQAILRMLRIMDKICTQLETGQSVENAHLFHVIEFIRVFADRCHHAKEEDLLFKAMEEAGIPREGGPIGVMLQEHDIGRAYVKGMDAAAHAMQEGDQKAAQQFAQNARGYIALLSQHIDKEDNILYRMADMHLSPAIQQELVTEFERVEEERVGHGKHEEFHRLLDHLESVYA